MKRFQFARVGLAALMVAALGMAGALYAGTGNHSAAVASARELGDVFAKVAHDAGPAVVSIEVEQTAPATFSPFGQMAPQVLHGEGSGFVVDSDGVILTNNHVVKDAKSIVVHMKDGRELNAKVVGTDPATDVAVLRVDAKGLPSLKMANSDAIKVGSWVLAIGNPFGLGETVTAGIVSAKSRNHVGITSHENFIQADAAINPGNSGGPLLDLDGNVVGINSAILSRSGGNMGIGFAIPSNLVVAIKDQILQTGAVHRGFLGVVVQPVDKALAESFGLDRSKGALIAEVSEDSPAAKAGLEPGDIVLSAGGHEIDNPGGLRNAVALLKPGTTIKLDVLRDGKHMDVSVVVGSREGATVAERDLGLGLAVEGNDLVIREVRPGSPAAEAGLRPGMVILEVNHKTVRSLRDYRSAMETNGDTVLLRVDDGNGARYIAIPLK